MNECRAEITVYEKSGGPLTKRIAEALAAAELGVRFDFSLEATYPPAIAPNCLDDLKRSVGAKLLVERAGLGL